MTWDFAIVLFIVSAVAVLLILRSRFRAAAKAKAKASEEEQTGNKVHDECAGVCEGCSFADRKPS
jgi:hypothetical protein